MINYFKLLNNTFYGKTCENIRNRKEINCARTNEQLIKMQTKPNLKKTVYFNKKLAATVLEKSSQKFDKPIYIGATKLLMYKFYYRTLVPYFGKDNIELVYQDTDSFVLNLKTKDLQNDLLNLKEHFDFSNYPKENKLYTDNKKIPGYFKDELAGEEMIKFTALRCKMYAFITAKDEVKRLKGIARNTVLEELNKVGLNPFDDKRYILEDGIHTLPFGYEE
jgi:hypothetical protein